jgi:hypothetical protein
MLDNGAFSQWKRNRLAPVWDGFYGWAKEWLEYQTTWAVIPDVIGGTEIENDRLIAAWYLEMGSYKQAAPVWHLHESIDRLDRLVYGFDRVCFGSSGEFATIGSTAWNNRLNEAFNQICRGSGRPPAWIHMLRGMSLSGSIYPFASVDSTDIARNHNRPHSEALEMANRWDAMQCPAKWKEQPTLKPLELAQ